MLNLFLDLLADKYTLYELAEKHYVSTRQIRRRINALGDSSYFHVRARPLAPTLQETKNGRYIYYALLDKKMRDRIIKRFGKANIFVADDVKDIVEAAHILKPLIDAAER